MPSYMEVTVETMNYASVVFVGFVAISALWYWVWGHKNYVGPPTDAIDPEVEQQHEPYATGTAVGAGVGDGPKNF
jgi:hypothetical protein